MTRVLRYDAGTLQRARKTSQGYLRVDGWASRTGILEYRNPDGSVRRELREPDAVFSQESLLGFEGAPVTDDHPSVMVDLHNAKALTKGTVLSVGRKDGEHVAVSLVITDPDLIRKMESGKRQLSTGYYVHLDETPGHHPDFGRYDAKQVRVGPVNHLAVVERGRAGTATVRMDGAELEGLVEIRKDDEADDLAVRLDALDRRFAALKTRRDSADDLHLAKDMPQSGSVMNITEALARITELEAKLDAFEAAAAEAPAPGKQCGSCDAMNAADAAECAKCGATLAAPEGEKSEKPAFLKKDAEDYARLEGERDVARKDAEDAKAEAAQARKDAEETANKKVRESLDVLTKAKSVLPANFKVDGKDLLDAPLRAVKCAVVKHVDGDTIATEKHDAYVEALFERAVKTHANGAKSLAATRQIVEAPRADAQVVSTEDAEAKASAALKHTISSAWMTSETETK